MSTNRKKLEQYESPSRTNAFNPDVGPKDVNSVAMWKGVNDSESNSSHLQKLSNICRISARGRGIKFVSVKRPAIFTVNAPSFEQDDISVNVTAPSGREIPVRLETIKHGVYEVEYITPEVGEHLIEVVALGKPINGSPFRSSAYDASKIKVGQIPSGIINTSIQFEIDGSEAGSGNLEILVNGGRVTSEVKSLGNHRFLASFVPHTPTVHIVEMKFNEDVVPGSPWKCVVLSPAEATSSKGAIQLHSSENFAVGQTHSFDITAPGYAKEDLEVSITGPGKIPVQFRMVDLQNETFRVYLSASVVGTYLFEVKIVGESQKATLTSKAYDINRIHISDVPHKCFFGEKCEFQVDASQAGEGQLEIAVNDGEVPNQVQVLGNGKCTVSFKPESMVPHIVDIKFNGLNVPGCPFTVEVADAAQFSINLSHVELTAVGRKCAFQIVSKTLLQPDSIKAVITSPSGNIVPVSLRYADGCVCEFTPTEIGPHLLSLDHAGKPILATPFVFKTYDAGKVLVIPSNHGCIGKQIEFVVDASNSGEGNLEISVTAKGKNVVTHVHPIGGAKFRVTFTPTELAEHFVLITFNNEPVPESPFKVLVGSSSQKVTVTGNALHFAPVNQLASLTVHNVSRVEDVNIKIEDPNGQTVTTTAKALDSRILVEFTPVVPGEHLINVMHKGSSIAGSPFYCKVYEIKHIKVKDIPKEVTINKPVTFLVEATNAGPGNLEVIVNNGRVPSTPQALGPSLYAITFVPKEAEVHNIEIKFNGELVPGAPFTCLVVDSTKVAIHKQGLDRVSVESPASFFVETNGLQISDYMVTVLGPTHKLVTPEIVGEPHAGYTITFYPTEVGDHLIDVKAGTESVPDCPFLVKVYDSRKVKVSEMNNGILGKPVSFSIDASQAGAGNLEIIVSTNGRNVPNYVQSEGNAKFKVNFKPTEANTHLVSVKFNGEAVPGSPYSVKVMDSFHPLITANQLKTVSLTKGLQLSIPNKHQTAKDCVVYVSSPSGKRFSPEVVKKEDRFDVNLVSTEVGPHFIIILLDGNTIPGCPFNCNVYDVSKVKVTGLMTGLFGKPLTFQVDASQAGEGTLELVVTTRKSSVRAEVTMRSRGLYDVTFIPQEPVAHYINITFNEEDVPGSPFKVDIIDESNAMSRINHNDKRLETRVKDGLGLVGSTNTVWVDLRNERKGSISVKVTGPQEKEVPATVTQENGKLKVEYVPKEVGTHKLNAFLDGVSIMEQPMIIEVSDPSRVKLLNVQDGVIGREQAFKVDCTRAGRGEMNVTITAGEKDVHHTIKEISSGVYLISYIPKIELPHQIAIYYNGHIAPGCPQTVEIRDPSQSIIVHGAALKSSVVGKSSTFIIETGGFAFAKDFDVIITDPKDLPVPVKCYQQKDGSLLAEFQPILTGSHKIDVYYMEKQVNGSPFICEAFDASKVILQQIKSTNFVVNEKICFTLNRKEAGYAELDVTVTSPLGRHLPIEVKGTPDGEGELIEFIPTVPGKYKIAITFGGFEVPLSPVTFIAQEGNLPTVEGLEKGCYNEPVTFTINAKGVSGTLEVRVDGPDSEAPCTIKEADGIYIVSFTPAETGLFDVRVLWNGRELPGSPFHPKIVNVHNVRPIGGWENLVDENGVLNLTTNEEKKVSFDVTDAGPGKLSAEIMHADGSTVASNVTQTGPFKYKVSFVPKQAGEYRLNFYFSGILLPKCPLSAVTLDTIGANESPTVVLRGHGLAGARVGEETEFVIDGSEAGPGQPDITLTGVKADIVIKLKQISQRVYKAIYTPSIPGTYLLNVIWANKRVKGCPLKVSILPRCDASRVICTGDGLASGVVGKEIKAFIDTRRAGPGDLTAHCTGPHKAAYCELYDQMDGTFNLFIKPQEGGRHTLVVKYGGEHVPGSPFVVKIAGPPDASKVKVYGPGIVHGVLPLYQSRFMCDTRGAGAGQLTVRIRGPKGAFRVEMQRENQKDRTILCKYDPTEPGDYRIEIKWSGEHVPGSPFTVMIFDTQEELNRFLQGQPVTPGTTGTALPPPDYFVPSVAYGSTLCPRSWRSSINAL